MIIPNTYCKVCGMVLQCIVQLQKDGTEQPVVLEIGCAEGDGVARYMGFCKRVICIDPMAEGRPDILSWKKEEIKPDPGKMEVFQKNTTSRWTDINVILASSLWPETLDDVKDRLGDDLLDILVIDGAHHPAKAIRYDFETYSDLVREGGYVIFDDIYEPDVRTVYDEAKALPTYEVYEEWERKIPTELQAIGALKKIVS